MESRTGISTEATEWICECGKKNIGNFCVSCGKPKIVPKPPVDTGESPELKIAPKTSDTPAFSSLSTDGEEVQDNQTSSAEWGCTCGKRNVGNFCVACGNQRPKNDEGPKKENIWDNDETVASTSSTKESSPPPQIPEITPTANVQDSLASPFSGMLKLPKNKIPMPIAALVIVVVIAFFGSGKLADSYYASKTEECVAIMTESKRLLDNLAELPGDSTSEDVKKIADGLALNASKLSSIRSGLVGKLPRKPEQEKAWDVIGKNAEMLSRAAAVVQSQERAFAPMSIKRFSALCDECMAKWDEANMASTYATVKNQPLSDLIPYADIKKDLQTYRRNKQAFDAKHAQEKNNEELKKHQEQNNKLKKMPEVVFLADNAYKNGNDLILSGRFYNGTGDLVTSIMDMQIDLKVSLFGTEVQSLKDEPFSLQLSGLRLMPQQTTDVVQLRLPGKAPEEDFNEFEEHVHKIRWSRMKAR